jgi:hypothetical protein
MEPLPKRVRRKRDGDTSVVNSNVEPQDNNVSLLETQTQTQRQSQLLENIQFRKEAQGRRAVASLDTKDGVAGEFYECKHYDGAIYDN